MVVDSYLFKFNRAMRYKAGVMGYSLNQKGLYEGVVRDPRNRRVKLNHGECIRCNKGASFHSNVQC